MRTLLTGTSGQVGGALLPLLRHSHEVLAPNRAEFDLSDPNALAAALDRLEVDLIFNPAAYTAVDRAEDEPELAFRINAEAPAELARWAARHNVPVTPFVVALAVLPTAWIGRRRSAADEAVTSTRQASAGGLHRDVTRASEPAPKEPGR